MPRLRRRRRPPLFIGFRAPGFTGKQRAAAFMLVILVTLSVSMVSGALYLRRLSMDIAMSRARDKVTAAITGIISARMSEEEIGYDYFVTLERDVNGGIVALTSNVGAINLLSSELLSGVVEGLGSGSGDMEIGIPLGSIIGPVLLLGRGPDIPVEIVLLTSPELEFRNSFISAGINQTRHQIFLDVYVDTDVIIPWDKRSHRVSLSVLVAETVIVGSVPDSFINWGNSS